MAWTTLLGVTVGDATKETDYDTLSANAEYLQTLADVEHDFHVATGDGGHKSITMPSGATINFDSGDIILTHSANTLTLTGGTASGFGGVALTGSTNNQVTTVTGADAMQGEANMLFDGDNLSLPTHSCFFATQASLQSNITGNGTFATIDFGTERFDQGGDLSGSTFTAPIAGRYHLVVNVKPIGITSSHVTGFTYFVTSNGSFAASYGNFYAMSASGEVSLSSSMIVDMDAADTAFIQVYVTGGTQVVDIAPDLSTTFGGVLLA
tara:strand:- start:728 stop:1525 length:798 start_codon:yes stop_codon:yes gene_type:complete